MTKGQAHNAARFISFEGVDGSGKTTQIGKLETALRAKGFDVCRTREPGGSDGAEAIRALLTTGETGRWSAHTELLLFNAARRDHLERTIQPALDSGKIVLCDRFADSTRVYQGVTRGDLRALADELHQLMITREPDLTLILDIDPKISLHRGLARGTSEARFEAFGLDFQIALRKGFLELAKAHPERIIVINAEQEIDAISSDILMQVSKRI